MHILSQIVYWLPSAFIGVIFSTQNLVFATSTTVPRKVEFSNSHQIVIFDAATAAVHEIDEKEPRLSSFQDLLRPCIFSVAQISIFSFSPLY